MNILFLCTGNSARSILGEVIVNDLYSQDNFAYSAGSEPVGKVNPMAFAVLKNHDHETKNLRSKNIDEFIKNEAPTIDLIISVCDSARQDCPVWVGKGNPKRLHWSLPDPAAIQGTSEKEQAFEETYTALKEKLTALLSTL